MANSFAEYLASVLLAAMLADVAVAAPASKNISLAQSKEPISVDAGSTDIDSKTHLIYLRRGVKITQGEISVSAEEAQATGLDFNNTRWVFTGKVHIRAESHGDLRSDKANVEFSNNVLARAIVTGSPAQFEQLQSTTPTGTLASGHASSIDYDVIAGVIKFTGDALLFDGPHKMDAPSITYNVRERQLQGESSVSSGTRVHMTIVPKGDSGSAPATAPSTDHDANAGPAKP